MNFIRIKDKIINLAQINNAIVDILSHRSNGLSQQEVAVKYNLDRTFISKLETFGKIRRSNNIAVIGFPIQNKDELISILSKNGIIDSLIMTEDEREDFVRSKNGADLVNEISQIISYYKKFDIIILLCSDKRNKLLESLFVNEVISIVIGKSPLSDNIFIDPEMLDEIIKTIKVS